MEVHKSDNRLLRGPSVLQELCEMVGPENQLYSSQQTLGGRPPIALVLW